MLPNLLSSINVCASNGHQHEFPRAKEGISVLGFSSKAPYKNKPLKISEDFYGLQHELSDLKGLYSMKIL